MATTVNGLDVAALGEFAETVKQDPANGRVQFNVKTQWQGQTRTVTSIESYSLGGQRYPRNFEIAADEPVELLGSGSAPNPQELLMAGLNACMSVGYAAVAATKGITVRSLEIETTGELDLRGFLGLDEAVNPGYDEVHYTVRIDADATPEQIQEIHEAVMRTSPNFSNFAKAIHMVPKVEIAGS
ncbi:MAG: OsmC family protein [Mycobacterium sp.]|uniref:OsmC family protein n=1 Tax=Mycobacterium sp. TaxID=1785 RepID=UPI00262B27BF|nr:OsmC family protein [Mycobacterium sp.]MDI3313384.1 OsmC family protein [Mycobacterium sp.]